MPQQARRKHTIREQEPEGHNPGQLLDEGSTRSRLGGPRRYMGPERNERPGSPIGTSSGEILKKKIQVEGPTDIEKHIKKAAQEATTTTQVDADAPNPDHHLTNLQEARHKALLRYRRKKTDTSRRIILNRATQEVTAYTRKLRKQTWIQHCEGFNDRTGVKKLWNTYRAMLGKKKEKSTGRNLALKLNMLEEELAQKLGETFFPQPDVWTPLLIEHTEERKEQDVKFSIEELNYAIRFRKGLCTQDSLAMLHHDLTSRKVTKVPKFLVAVDIRKAFDSIPHKSVIASAKENGIEGNMLRFIQDFLEERTYKVKVGETEGLIQYNRIGVPQGAILSPTLFNITMTALAKKLEKIPNLSFTIYADDVTIWTKGGQTGKQVKAIKEALRAIDDFAEEVGLQVAPEKTALVIIATPEGRKATASKHKFTSAGRQLEPTSSTKILGMNISQDGKAKEWLEGLRKSWTHILGIIRRTATKSWGANENTLRTLIHAFLVSKAIYGYNYTTLTKTQQEKIKCLMRKAQRVVTGLPNHARLEEVRKWALLNDIEDIAREGAVSQIIRLHGTKAGRVILTKLRKINLQMEEPEEPLPPWETSLPQEGKPPPNAGRETASTRHQNRIQALKDPNKEVIYTDATVTRENRAACAWYNITTEKTGRATLPEKTTVRDAEIEAIAKTIKDHQGNTGRKYYIFSDSREAIQEYRSPATTLKTVQETSKYIDEAKKAGTSFTLEWVPGHAGIQGHDRAEREAKAALIHHYSTLSQLPAVDSIDSTDPYDYPPDIAKQPKPNAVWQINRLRRCSTVRASIHSAFVAMVTARKADVRKNAAAQRYQSACSAVGRGKRGRPRHYAADELIDGVSTQNSNQFTVTLAYDEESRLLCSVPSLPQRCRQRRLAGLLCCHAASPSSPMSASAATCVRAIEHAQ
ncbi:hypothetical protein HPB47_007974 [Ixodes persulcatus]|uniref:Uncharacterized protein n=1 Tax=Ixodes persulcatus TaxID=34615 RepID=A0AC60P6D6_IXOPE|nr:hypothetical protein HPB47_007974 [Ixodes persulcatus]